MENVEFYMRQGDVYIYKIDNFPKGETYQDELTRNSQLALGELSGHNHYFDESGAIDLFKIRGHDSFSFLEVKKSTNLIHGRIKGFKGNEADKDYHSEITIPEGRYITGIVPETDWISRTIKKVVD